MNIENIMQQKKITRYRLSKLSGVSYSHITDIVNGVSIPGVVIAQKLAESLEVSLDELLGKPDNPKPAA